MEQIEIVKRCASDCPRFLLKSHSLRNLQEPTLHTAEKLDWACEIRTGEKRIACIFSMPPVFSRNIV